MRIPFDSLTLAAVVAESQSFVGGKVQKIWQPDDFTVVLDLYARGTEGFLLISCHSDYFRAHFSTRRPRSKQPLPGLAQALRSRIEGAHIASITQRGFDRILDINLDSEHGKHRLVAELMGRYSNLMLLDPGKRVIAAAKWVPLTKSKRPIESGKPYLAPPFEPKRPLTKARFGEDLRAYEGASPFLVRLIGEGGVEVLDQVKGARYAPIFSPGNGSYPVSIAVLGMAEIPQPTVSIALEKHYAELEGSDRFKALQERLTAQLKRVLHARDVALSDLERSHEAAKNARGDQLCGELILAYAHLIEAGADHFLTSDYEGSPLDIRLDPDKTPLENAEAYFLRAKKAKSGVGMVRQQIERLGADRQDVIATLAKVEFETNLGEMEQLRETAETRKWLNRQPLPAKREDRPYEGHRIRELLGPNNARVLYGENAASNDYLTQKVAKPNDYWLHVRGSQSAHVVVPTQNKPEKIAREVLLFAAKVAIRQSSSKHSSHVPVDYTLKKYVRKPRGSPVGFAVYTHEKTFHLDALD